MTRHSYSSITVFYAEQRHREMLARAEASRLARSVRRRHPVRAWLRRGWDLVARPAAAERSPRRASPRAAVSQGARRAG